MMRILFAVAMTLALAPQVDADTWNYTFAGEQSSGRIWFSAEFLRDGRPAPPWGNPAIPYNEINVSLDGQESGDWRNQVYWEDVTEDESRLRLNSHRDTEAWLYMPTECRTATPDQASACVANSRMELLAPVIDSPTLSLDSHVYSRGVADLNNDRIVDAADAGLLFATWGLGAPIYDFTRDGYQDAADAGVMFAAWTNADASPVPEPSGILAIIAAVWLTARSARR